MEGDAHPDKKALSDTRERVVARLTDAFARDELGLDAFERRINEVYGLATVASLEALVADLSVPAAVVEALAPARAELVVADAASRSAPLFRAVLGSVERTGTFSVGKDARASAVLGSLELDFRDAILPPGLTEVHVRAVLGSVEITVPADVAVECEGTGILGSFEGRSHAVVALDPNAPRLRIVGSAVLGSIEIRSKPPTRVQVHVEQLRAHKLLPR